MKSESKKSGSALVHVRGINKEFMSPGGKVKVLDNINLSINRGEFVAIVGKSGSGKSTLLNMITGIDRPSSGEVLVSDTAVHLLPEGPLAAWRGRNIGVVFQFFQLLPTLTVAENIMLPMDFIDSYPVKERRKRALALLDQVGIIEHADKLPSSLSGGQQQRAAIARALANDPLLVVADEPTGNLDGHTAGDVIKLFSNLVSSGTTVIIVTHERDVTTFADRAIVLSDGSIETELKGARSLRADNAREAAHA